MVELHLGDQLLMGSNMETTSLLAHAMVKLCTVLDIQMSPIIFKMFQNLDFQA